MLINKNNIAHTVPATGFTHAGRFHADEVFGTALLSILNPSFTVERGFKVPEDREFDIVYDIGNGEFDHHSEPRECRDNGTPYAAFGKLWRTFGPAFLTDESIAKIDQQFVEPIDATDNGCQSNPMSVAIGAMNPGPNASPKAFELAFKAAVQCATTILCGLIESAQVVEHEKKAAVAVAKAAAEAGHPTIAVTDQFHPIISHLCNTQVEVYVYPALRGGWNAQLVTVSPDTRATKVKFPAEWAGAPADQLPEGVTFCHAAGFLLAADTKEAAIKAAEMAS